MNCLENLKWRCSKGHEWFASLNTIRNRGTWCRQCAIAALRLSLKDAQAVALAREGMCLSAEYLNSRMHLRWRCSKGHEWPASLNTVKNKGCWCPGCAGRMPLSLTRAQELALKRGGRCLSNKYINNKKNLKWQCSKGHKWSASLNSIKNHGSWCPHCVVEASRLSLRDAQAVALSRRGTYLSIEYVGATAPMKWQCSKGHKWIASLNQIKNRGSWCPQCAGNAPLSLKVAQDVAAFKGGACLSKKYLNNKKKLKWKCREGHAWSASLNRVKDAGTWCPECSAGSSEREVRRILEHSIFPGKSFRKCRPKFLSTDRGGRLELDGYCEELGIAFEYQGEQHYHRKSYFHRGKRGSFENQVARDALKLARCREVGVELLIVPYFKTDTEAHLRTLLAFPEKMGIDTWLQTRTADPPSHES